MIVKNVTSSSYPEQIELLQGKKLINVDVIETTQEIEGEEISTYNYTQIVAEVSVDTDNTLAEYQYSWAISELESSDIQIKYHERNSARASLTVEDWYQYQEELRDYATVSDGVYSLRTEKPVRPSIT